MPPLSNDLLEDLLNPSISSLDLCAIHKLSLPALADLLESDKFKLAKSCMQRISTSRTDYVRPEAEALALVRTHDILKDKPTTPAHAETQRKASAYFLPSMSQIRQGRNGGGAEQSEAEGASQLHLSSTHAASPAPAGEVSRASGTEGVAQKPSASNQASSPSHPGKVDRRSESQFHLSRDGGGSPTTLPSPTTPANSLVTHTNKMLHSHHTFPHASPERAITMSHRKNKSINAIIAATVGAAASLSSAQNLFTYQGTLNDNGAPADGTYDFRFTLWDDQTIGAPDTQLGFTNPRSGVPVENGVFSVQLDMGTTDFSTAAGRYLQIEVRPSGGGGPYTTLNPRTPIDFAPRSIFSLGAEVAERLTLPYVQNGFPASSSSGIFNITNIDTSGYAIGADGPTWGLVGFGGDYSSFPPIQTPAGVFGIGERVGTGGSSDTGSGIYGITSTGNGGEFTVLSTNSGNALRARTAGSGHAGLFERAALTGSTAALRVTNASTSSSAYGVHSTITSTSPGGNSTALRGENRGEGFLGIGVWGSHNGSGWGIYGTSGSGGLAGNFAGNVFVSGSLSKGSGTFKIDHPLDPANMYLSHSFVESPDMKNIYDGVVTLNEDGTATVTMPSYFDALNTEFRYQLTCIGGYAPVYIAEEINERQFSIAGGSPGLKVSWQITGIRQDPFAQANPVIVEEQKSAHEQGRYLHPELYDQPEEKGIYYVDPDTQQQN
ncbi:MAG: hypothetical protein JJ916_09150 [Phycisphaerales bacterium]|nr:hypothetical protein [Phycisphaerales bacterium]